MKSEQVKKHLENFIAANGRSEFGCTAIQRDCKIRYADAFRVIEVGVKSGIFERLGETNRVKMVIDDDCME